MADTVDDLAGYDLKLAMPVLAKALITDGKAKTVKEAEHLIQAAKARAKLAELSQAADKVREKIRKAEAAKKKLEASRKGKQSRADYNRYRILIGVAVLEASKHEEKIGPWLTKALGKYIVKDKDRAFLGLPPKIEASERAASAPAHVPAQEPESASAGPLVYFGFTYPKGERFAAYMPDFRKIGKLGEEATVETAKKNMGERAREHAATLPTLPPPSNKTDARRAAAADLASLFGGTAPELTAFEVEIPR